MQDGSLPGSPSPITQTSDGYIWVGTDAGLVRFDGVRFTRWNQHGSPQLSFDSISALMASGDGSLWIGDYNGPADSHVHHWSNGRLSTYDTGAVVPIAFAAKGDEVWFLKSPTLPEVGGSLCRIVGENIKCFGREEGLHFGGALTFDFDAGGHAWIAADDRLVEWTPGSSRTYQPAELKPFSGGEIPAVIGSPDGSVYVGFSVSGPGMGLEHIEGDKWSPIRATNFVSDTLKVTALYLDRHNALWVGTLDRGIYRISGSSIDNFTAADGLSDNYVHSIYEDSEGTIWASTTKGVDNFRDMPVTTYLARNGLCTGEPDSVLAARDGTVWVGGAAGLCALRNSRFSSILHENGLPGHQVMAMFEDHAGHLWVGVDEGLYIYEDGRFTEIRRSNNTPIGLVIALTEDVEHNIWAETSRPVRGLFRIAERKVSKVFLPSSVPAARTLSADASGGIWLGLFTGDLARFHDEHLDVFRYQNTIGKWVVNVYVDFDGIVYGATQFGAIVWNNGKQGVLSSKNGLPCDDIYNIVSDRSHNMWLYSKCGLIRVSSEDMQHWQNNHDTVVHPKLFSALDGAWPYIAPFESSQRGPDGSLWFVNTHYLQTINPEHWASNPKPPSVLIEDVIADQRHYAIDKDIRLSPHVRNLELDYTALSFVVPQRVRFRYRLDGRDNNWQDAGTRREAFYTDLSPGRYRFHVIACNNDGIWNDIGAAVEFWIAPAWYQTIWFRILCCVLFLVAIWAVYAWRVNRLAAAMRIRFNERLDERTRMARELHDTFLQTVQGSKMVVEDALNPNTDSAKMRQALQKLSGWLTQAVDEGRAALHALRISTTERNHLSEALKRATEYPLTPSSMNTSFATVGDVRDLHPIVRDEIYRIAFEAIRNSALHSKASRLQVELRYANDLTVIITDNGVGIDPSLLEHGRAKHFGLQGMRERAARIRGKLSIVSSADTGTEVVLNVPGSVVYRTASPS
jgi:signal transduction histidine kinase/ligand-binding sensor domain-containing protein